MKATTVVAMHDVLEMHQGFQPEHWAQYPNFGRLTTVRDDDRCPWGFAWYRKDATGAWELWRYNFDSSG